MYNITMPPIKHIYLYPTLRYFMEPHEVPMVPTVKFNRNCQTGPKKIYTLQQVRELNIFHSDTTRKRADYTTIQTATQSDYIS
jgi:hypothetical protein